MTVPPPVTETTATTSTTLPADTTPPGISVTSPADGTHFETELVTFIGSTEPGAGVVAGGTYAAYVDADGVWSIQLVLAPGANGATFVATDEAGNQSVAKLVVHLDVPEEAPPGDKPPPPTSFEFTANQTYGTCEENPPYDVFYGAADPHTPVSISSPYGGGTVKSDAEGNWELRVTFPEAPFEGDLRGQGQGSHRGEEGVRLHELLLRLISKPQAVDGPGLAASGDLDESRLLEHLRQTHPGIDVGHRVATRLHRIALHGLGSGLRRRSARRRPAERWQRRGDGVCGRSRSM